MQLRNKLCYRCQFAFAMGEWPGMTVGQTIGGGGRRWQSQFDVSAVLATCQTKLTSLSLVHTTSSLSVRCVLVVWLMVDAILALLTTFNNDNTLYW